MVDFFWGLLGMFTERSLRTANWFNCYHHNYCRHHQHHHRRRRCRRRHSRRPITIRISLKTVATVQHVQHSSSSPSSPLYDCPFAFPTINNATIFKRVHLMMMETENILHLILLLTHSFIHSLSFYDLIIADRHKMSVRGKESSTRYS